MALEGLARIYARERLNLPLLEESVLRELIGLMPSDIALLFRLAALQERQARIDDAEDTLQMARRQQPDQLEPYRQLAQFYARRAVAIQPRPQPIVPASTAAADAAEAARPDDRGVFSIGGAVTPPRREDVAQMPEDAKLLGVEGAVRIEVVIDEDGSVQDATIVRSVPLLDAEALRAVRHWRFAPTIVDGKAVPVRMQVVVNFRQ
jgi:TonB family protein